jgi:hypothetical protein
MKTGSPKASFGTPEYAIFRESGKSQEGVFKKEKEKKKQGKIPRSCRTLKK